MSILSSPRFSQTSLLRPNKKNSTFSAEVFVNVNGACSFFFSFLWLKHCQRATSAQLTKQIENTHFFPCVFYVLKIKKKDNVAAILKCGCRWETGNYYLAQPKETQTYHLGYSISVGVFSSIMLSGIEINFFLSDVQTSNHLG